MQRNRKLVLLILTFLPALAYSQNVRYDAPFASTVSGSGQQLPVYALPFATIKFYSCSGSTCTTLANTYPSASSSSACSTAAQVVLQGTSVCTAQADGEGNFGAWFFPGQYAYTISPQYGGTYGPFQFTVGDPPGSGLSNFYTPEQFGATHTIGHDDTYAIQACMNSAGICVPGKYTYYLNSQLSINETRASVMGYGPNNATIFQSSYNGCGIKIGDGPITDITLQGFALNMDPALANSCGFDFTASNTGGFPGGGGLWNSNIRDVSVNTPAKEALKMVGGPSINPLQLVDQFNTFTNFNCSAAAQSHPLPMISLIGTVAQTTFRDGSCGGDNNNTDYPFLLKADVATPSGNDAPAVLHIEGLTLQGGAVGVWLNQVNNFSFHSKDMENVGTGFQINGGNSIEISNSQFRNVGYTGGIVNLLGAASASFFDNGIAASTGPTKATYTVNCSNYNSVIQFNNTANFAGLTSNGCTTTQYNPANILTTLSQHALINGDNGATPIVQLQNDFVASGNELTLWVTGGYVLFETGAGQNIDYGQYSSPLKVLNGSSITFYRGDVGGQEWHLHSVDNQILGVHVAAPQHREIDTSGKTYQTAWATAVHYMQMCPDETYTSCANYEAWEPGDNGQVSRGPSSVWSYSGTGGISWGGGGAILSSDNACQISGANCQIITSTLTVGRGACVKVVGPPVVFGYCSTAVDSTGACTCN